MNLSINEIMKSFFIGAICGVIGSIITRDILRKIRRWRVERMINKQASELTSILQQMENNIFPKGGNDL